MSAVVFSRLLLTALAAVLGGSGIFLLWASFRVPVADTALVCLLLAAGIMLGMPRE